MTSNAPHPPGPILCLVGVLMLAMGACAQRPTDEIAAAVQAVAEAKGGVAALYAGEDLQRLDAQIASLTASSAEQDAQLSVLRDYTAVERLAHSVTRQAHRVIAAATEQHEAARSEAIAAIEEAQEAVNDSRSLVTQLKTQRRLGLIRRQAAETDALEQSMSTAREALVKEDYPAAEARARAILAQATVLSGHMQSIAARLGGNVGTRLAQN